MLVILIFILIVAFFNRRIAHFSYAFHCKEPIVEIFLLCRILMNHLLMDIAI
jgi:hypothetical protein